MRKTYSKDFKTEETSFNTGTKELQKRQRDESMSQCTLSKWRQSAKKQLNVEQTGIEDEYDKLTKDALGFAQD